ncbi:unnamed protein product [Dibothriocephalus latus]|uniref:Fucosyltransferase n=1 Tax=Dibothriocephalus latus TaxID=60516 RepID=A0A3P7LTV3_DIBLA|nr:unnamed protein product [Dibothriocephalus latus]
MGCIRDAEFTCLKNLSLQYKFYLAFENSNCAGHITEKFFVNGLSFGMLPVVMGASREVYCAVAPPNSFIHVDDFSSPAELADYLNWLDKNDDAYASYFAWQAYGKVLVRAFARNCSKISLFHCVTQILFVIFHISMYSGRH